MDLLGPLLSFHGFTHLLTVVDRPNVVRLLSTTSAEVARAFISAGLARFGMPSDITSDRGAQFTSELWTAVAGSLGMKLHRATAYNLQAN